MRSRVNQALQLQFRISNTWIEVTGVESRLEEDLDPRGFWGLSEDVPVGYEGVRVYFTWEYLSFAMP
jgi:hypothetical protein